MGFNYPCLPISTLVTKDKKTLLLSLRLIAVLQNRCQSHQRINFRNHKKQSIIDVIWRENRRIQALSTCRLHQTKAVVPSTSSQLTNSKSMKKFQTVICSPDKKYKKVMRILNRNYLTCATTSLPQLFLKMYLIN